VFTSLRAKLIASYALVIVLTLTLVASGFAYVLRSYQTTLRLNQLADYAVPLTFAVERSQRLGASADEIDKYLHEQANDLDVRIFLLGPNRTVMLDTDQTLIGRQLPLPTEERARLGGQMQWGTLDVPDGPALTFIAVTTPPPRAPSRDAPTVAPPNLVVAVPESSIGSAWLELAPSLFLGAFIALVLSIAVAIVLARSIARPLAQVTAASERMATGDFDQYIDVRGHDEVGLLASSFNTMAREVGQMHRTMRDFLANVSHELRTPLTSIEGYSQAMTDGTITSPDQYRDAALIIGEEAGRMHRLVEDLLYLSRIESGQIDIVRSKLDLTELLRNCVRQVQPQIESAGLAIDVEAAPIPPILADRHRLQQVFVNLLDNAVKHTPKAGSIDVRAYPTRSTLSREPVDLQGHRSDGNKADGNWVAVDVHNTGSYIPPDHVNRIFERFYQVDQARSRNGDGHGLGLAIVQQIVQAHHGRVEVSSDPGKGTTFTVYLPAA
jgi:signal transduction histidine kinase